MPQPGEILSNRQLKGEYFKVEFYVPEICEKTAPGQFTHCQIARLRDRMLRRPFSICNVTDDGVLTVVYKVVGEGTEMLSTLPAGEVCNLIGPFGNGFSLPAENQIPLIVAGGYGSAATYLLAKNSPHSGILLLGARTEADLIMADDFAKLGFEVKVATDDGSIGHHGLVTELLEQTLLETPEANFHICGCGPEGMLMAMGKMLLAEGLNGELSLDHRMCCGVGACFACVVKVVDKSVLQGWRYARTCREGPVFKADEIYYGPEHAEA